MSDDEEVFGFGAIIKNDAKHKQDQLMRRKEEEHAAKSAMVRARKASLQVKSSEFERQLGAQKLEEANRRQVEKRRNMMQEYKGTNRMSSMVDEDDEDYAAKLDIGSTPRVDLSWEMAQASNDDRGTRPEASPNQLERPKPMSSGALTTIAAAKIEAMTSNAKSTSSESIMRIGKGVPARSPRANSIAEVPAVGGAYIPAAITKSHQKVHGVGGGNPQRKTRSDPNAQTQPVPIHLFKKEETEVIDKASAWIKERQSEVPFEVRLAQKMKASSMK